MLFATVYRRLIRVTLILLVAVTLLSPALPGPGLSGDCASSGSTACTD